MRGRAFVACQIRTIAANQRVINSASAAIQRVIAIAAIQHIGLAVTDDAVIAIAAKDIFNADQAVIAMRAG